MVGRVASQLDAAPWGWCWKPLANRLSAGGLVGNALDGGGVLADATQAVIPGI